VRARPIRPNIYLPVVRLGVADSDWFSVLLISCAGYLLPVPFGMTVLYVPLQMWTWLIATAGSIAFFNYIRIGKKPYWLQHKVKAVFLHHRQYRAIPDGRKRPFNRGWLIEIGDGETSPYSALPKRNTTQTALLLDHNSHIQEACEQRWNEQLVSTN
jgi:hypothetical protein